MSNITTDTERLENLERLSDLVEKRSLEDREFRRAIGTLPDDLTQLTEALRIDPLSWRQARAFHVVHVPSFIAIVSMLDDIDQMPSVTDDEKHQLFSSINRAAQLAKSARQGLEQSKLAQVRVEVDVLAEYAPQPAEPYQKPSRLTRALDTIAAASENVWSGAKSRAPSVPGMVDTLQEGVSGTLTRAASVPVLLGNLQKSLTGAVSDSITSPISMRLAASGRALKHGVGAGVGLGVVAGVLCPPLLPVSAGGAVLAAMRAWRKEMDKAQSLNEVDRQQRIAQLQVERATALRQLTRGEPAFQMETDDISMTLDVETGAADAVVLKGDYAGRMWSSMSPAEKAETGLYLAEGAASLLSILEYALKE